MDKRVNGHAAIIVANVIFGLGVPVTKYLLEDWVTPMTYMATRCIGAALIFWVIAAFLPKEKMERKDLMVILLAGLLGFVVSQTLTAWALNYTSPVYYSLIATLTPIVTMLLAIPFLHEGTTPVKTLGVFLGIGVGLVLRGGGVLDGADGADEIVEHLAGSVCLLLIVRAAVGDVVGVCGEQNDKVALLNIQ